MDCGGSAGTVQGEDCKMTDTFVDARETFEKVKREASVVSDVSVVPAWPQMDEAAYQGLAGEIVGAIEPHTESDPVAILMQTLALAGNAIGHAPYYRVEATSHHTNLFAVLV